MPNKMLRRTQKVKRLHSSLQGRSNNRLFWLSRPVNPLRTAYLAVNDFGAQLLGGGTKLQITACRGAAILLIKPGLLTDLGGAALIVTAASMHLLRFRRSHPQRAVNDQ